MLLLEMASTVAQDGQAAGTEARKGGARPARVGGPFMAFMSTVFFALFVIMSEPPLACAWCASWACGSVCDMWSVTICDCDPFSWRVCSSRHESCLRACGHAPEDQGDLW